MDKTKIQSKKEKAYTAKDFAKEYEALVKKGFQIVAYPEWKRRDDGSFSTFIRMTVGQTPKQS